MRTVLIKHDVPQNAISAPVKGSVTRLPAVDLTDTVDPLMRSWVENAMNSTFSSLPEEILLIIFDHADLVSLYCLRRVCRTFRRLIYEPKFWRRVQPYGPFYGEHYCELGKLEQKQLVLLLQRDGMCHWCRLQGKYMKISHFKRKWDFSLGDRCRFRPSKAPRVYCPACRSDHDHREFEEAEQRLFKTHRMCVGRRGAVQLCEHIHISWSDVENHVLQWPRPSGENRGRVDWEEGEWKKCLDAFRIECNDPSHDRRCTDNQNPTWPQARLVIGKSDAVFLSLQWKPHSGIGRFTKGPDGQVISSELRELFREYRNSTGGIIFPSHHSTSLPEMACYRLDECSCVYYETGGFKMHSHGQRQKATNFVSKYGFKGCFGYHFYTRYGRAGSDERVEMERHHPTKDFVCLITKYERLVRVFENIPCDEKLNPSHAWLHAVDPDTYLRQKSNFILPLCKNRDCMNYYRRPKVFHCP